MSGLSGEAEARISRFIAELKYWGERVNLVGSTHDAALREHVLESLAPGEALPCGSRVVDLGSGAGFPGVPLWIARPDLELTLVESRERRVHFLRHVVRTLDLPIRVVRARIEDPPGELFEVALLRAVAPLPRSLELGSLWVVPEGQVWVWTREEPPDASSEVGRIALGARGAVLRLRPIPRQSV